MKKEKKLISVKEYADKQVNRRGFKMSESYVYRLIREYKAGKRASLDFDFEEIGQIIRIKE